MFDWVLNLTLILVNISVNIVFPLINTPGTNLILKLYVATLIGGRCLKQTRIFQSKRIYSYEISKLIILSFHVIINNYHYDIAISSLKYSQTATFYFYFFVVCVLGQYPVGIYMFRVNSRNIRTRCEVYSKLTIKKPERRLASSWSLYC